MRLGGLASRISAALVAVAVALVMAGTCMPSRAQDDPAGTSFVTPFPEGDVYRALVIGDYLAEGLLDGLNETFAGDVRLQLPKKHRAFAGVMRNDSESEMKALEEALQKETAHLVFVMFGADDRYPLRVPGGKRIAVGTDEWRAEYSRRIDRMMKVLKKRNAAVYWIGLPNIRRSEANDDAQIMNEAMRERAYLNNAKYVDAYAGFTDEQGGYSAYGPDVTGKIRLLREPDGVHFTSAGNRKLAHFVERELRRDLNQARNERTVPLAGTEAEQAKINPDKARLAPLPAETGARGAALAPGVSKDAKALPKAAGVAAAAGAAAADAGGDQKADHGKVNLRLAAAGGREEVVAIDILRPAIPASVIALVTRRESPDKPSQMGDTLVSELSGGLTVMNSVSPSAEGAAGSRRKLSPTQAPFFRLLVKGERLAAKPGRADDHSWPKPEPVVDVPPPPAPPPAATSAVQGRKPATAEKGAGAPASRPQRTQRQRPRQSED